MNELLLYLLKNALALILFYAFFTAFLQKETFFTVNRFYLLSSVAFAALLPFITITIPANSNNFPVIILNTVNIGEAGIENAIMDKVSVLKVVLMLYFAVSGIFLIKFLTQLTHFFVAIKKYPVEKTQNYKIISTDNTCSPYSFFGFIFINKKLYNQSDINKIISHEKIHIKQLHTIDLIIIEILCIFQWFNPVVWFYKRSIKEVHEYIADDFVLGQGHEKSAYQKLILNQISLFHPMGLANNFNHSLIKKRFQMMKKIKSKKLTYLKLLFAIPAIALGLLSVASFNYVNAISNVIPNVSGLNIDNPVVSHEGNDTVYKVAHTPPEYQGGQKAMQEYIITNIKYPQEAKKNGVMGTVYASFIVEKDGSVSNPGIIRGIGSGCDEEVIRIVSLMPKWKPGKDEAGNPVRVSFAIPVKFSLENKEKETKIQN